MKKAAEQLKVQTSNFKDMHRRALELRVLSNKLFVEVDACIEYLPAAEQRVDLLDAIDSLNMLECTLRGVTDGRPLPLDVSGSHAPSIEPGSTKEEIKRSHLGLKLWAECSDPGYDEKAHIAGIEFNEAELLGLRNWIDKALEFHKKNTKKVLSADVEREYMEIRKLQ